MLRPGAILTVDDEVIYTYLVGRMQPNIWAALKDTQGAPDVAYQLAGASINNQRWLKSGPRVYHQWRERSVNILDKVEMSHVVTSDITGFYENIDHERLLSDLRGIGVNEALTSILGECLKRWAGTRGKGIPQGYSASDVLAKVYLNVVDRSLQKAGYVHLRYVDDIRIFCPSRRDARRAIQRLSELMSTRGLNLQSAKTKILLKKNARDDFEGASQVLRAVTAQLKSELATEAALDPYATSEEIFAALGAIHGEAPEVLEKTFHEHFSLVGPTRFNTTLFHFLLSRLGASHSRVAVPYSLELFRERPEETDYVLRYLSNVAPLPEDISRVVDFVESEDAIYDYQLFQVLRWFFDTAQLDQRIIACCRRWAFDSNREPWLRDYAVAYLGEFGDTSDLEDLEARYSTLNSDLERANYAAALSRLESGRRSAAYKGMRADGDLDRRAIAEVEDATAA
jgi:hypothetical protein